MNWLRNRIAEWSIALERRRRRRAMKKAKANPAQVIDNIGMTFPDTGRRIRAEDAARMQ